MVAFTEDYIKSLRDSELKMLIPEKLESTLVAIRELPAADKRQLFDEIYAFLDRSMKKNTKSRKWFRFSNDKSKYSIVQSESPHEIMANGFKNVIRSLGKEYYDEVQKIASEAYTKQIRRKKTPAMWMLQFLAPIVRLKDMLFKKK
jgi:hypothetical protein